jgi:hypothetical protein
MLRRFFFMTVATAALSGSAYAQDFNFDPFGDNPAQRQVIETRRMRQAQEKAVEEAHQLRAVYEKASRDNNNSSYLVVGGIVVGAVVIAGAIYSRKV